MPQTKDSLRVTSTVDPALANQLNFVLARIVDRLDKLEGLRGELETASGEFSGPVSAESVSVSDDTLTLHSME